MVCYILYFMVSHGMLHYDYSIFWIPGTRGCSSGCEVRGELLAGDKSGQLCSWPPDRKLWAQLEVLQDVFQTGYNMNFFYIFSDKLI